MLEVEFDVLCGAKKCEMGGVIHVESVDEGFAIGTVHICDGVEIICVDCKFAER